MATPAAKDRPADQFNLALAGSDKTDNRRKFPFALAGLRQRLSLIVLVMSGLLTAAVLATTGGPLADPDVWWHVRTGQLILDTASVPNTDPWSFTAAANSWVPTAWLSDVLFASAWNLGSWDAVRILRVALALAVAVALWSVAIKTSGPGPAAALGVALVLLAVILFLRERPQVLSFLFVAWLATQADQVLRGQAPRLLVCVPLCWLWANVHGMWVLLPTTLLIVGVLAWLDDRRRVSLAARCTLIALTSWAVTLLTPVGPRLAVWPLVVRDVAKPITEWQPTLPLSTIGLPFTVIVALIVLSWRRKPQSPAHILYVGTVALFGLLAFRNVAPAAILLLPVLCRSLTCLLYGAAWSRPSRRTYVAVLAGAAAVGLAGATLRILTTPTIDSAQPLRITAELSSRSVETRVLNHYDVGGLLTGLASPPVRVAIDGRTDLWPADFVTGYINDTAGAGDWRARVDQLRPDAAVLPAGSEVARGLQLERGWRVTLSDGGWQLLERPV